MAEIYKSEAGRQAIEAQYRRALDRWPVPCEQRVIPTRQGDTFVVACGDVASPPLVLLHGSGANSSTWMRDVATWAVTHRVYATDVIGEPGLSAPARPPLASPAYADWLDDVWSGLGFDRAGVVGVSLGGWLGLDFAIRRPHRVTSLSLISPSGIGRQNAWLLAKVGLLRLFGRRGLVKSLEVVSGAQVQLPVPLLEALLVVSENFRYRRERIPRVSDAALAALQPPLLAIVGKRDALLDSAETRERIEALVPNARVIVADGGHILPPQTSVVASFLRGAESSTLAAADACAGDGMTDMTLISALAADNASTRLRAALAIGTNPEPGLVDILIARCAIESDFFVRDMLTWAVTRLASEITVPRLLAELRSEVAQARSQALHTLSKVKDGSAFPAITSSLLRDSDDDVARSAWRAAVVLVPDGEKGQLAAELAAQLGRGDQDLQRSLSRALVALGAEVVEPVLRSAMASDAPGVRLHASATERLLRDADAGAEAAVNEAKRQFLLKDWPA